MVLRQPTQAVRCAGSRTNRATPTWRCPWPTCWRPSLSRWNATRNSLIRNLLPVVVVAGPQMGAATAWAPSTTVRSTAMVRARTQPDRNSEFEEMVATAGPAQLAHRGGHDDATATPAKVTADAARPGRGSVGTSGAPWPPSEGGVDCADARAEKEDPVPVGRLARVRVTTGNDDATRLPLRGSGRHLWRDRAALRGALRLS